MSIEEQLAELTAAVKENTEAHKALADVAKAAQGTKAPAPAPGAAEEEEKAAPKTRSRAAKEKPGAEEKAAPKTRSRAAAKKKTEPELPGSVDRAEFMKTARAFLSPDDEEVMEANKEKFAAALDHLGASKMSAVDDEDLPKLAGYIAYWNAGLEVDFEKIDGLVAEASGGTDDMLD